jgi:type II restriction enzyme
MGSKPVGKKAERKIKEALSILNDLGVPGQQQNERSALTLLSLLSLKPASKWEDATDPLMGITPMMEFFEQHYGKKYAPNTRETVRRQTVHQFIQAALIVPNPDKPSRPTNSPKAVYQIEPSVLKLIRSFEKSEWKRDLQKYLRSVDTLKKLYAREREMRRIPVRLANGQEIRLSPGGQNVLVKKIVDDFCPLFTPDGYIIYVGDTQSKWAYFDSDALALLGVQIEEHGKMPDVVVHHAEKNWLVLIEAVTSHGPVNPKRREELKTLFAGASAGLVFVTAFLDRRAMLKYLNDISWETEVWIAESPTHLIHFNGERFLGPYE